jgi:protein involved in polysaccharide export with SLBB domain
MADLVAAAGGLTSNAFLFGAELDRTTVREQQKASFNRAIQNFEFALAAKPLTSSRASADDATRIAAAKSVVDRLRDRAPSGRLVLSISIDNPVLPGELVMENDDALHIPSEPTTVGVLGAVFQDGSFRYKPGMTIGDYLKLSGGTQDIADRSSIFVVRANGAVISDQGQWFESILGEPALPGDLVFVPVSVNSGYFWDDFKDTALVIYELGLGAASVAVLSK